MMLATGLEVAVSGRRRIELGWLAALPLLVLLPGVPPAERGNQSAVLVQPDVSETIEWTPALVEKMHRDLVTLSLHAARTAPPGEHPSIIVWPEVPAPIYYDMDPRLRDAVNNLARTANAYVLFGVVAHTPSGAPLNSAQLVSPEGLPVSRYDKIELVPFGEYVPWPFGFANKISTEIGDFAAGNRVVVSPAGRNRIGTFICYESVFPNLVRRFVANGAEVLFNISNDGWFGKTAARRQHLTIVRMRAAENRRWILRSTNDGITATIDPAGRLRGTLPLYVEAASRTGYSYLDEQTFYTRHGDWFAVSCAFLAAGLLLVSTVPAALQAEKKRRLR
jgi:apolipoprotein N-acyltransferase